MANEDKKDFNAMLHDSKDMPKFQIIIDQKSIEKYGGNNNIHSIRQRMTDFFIRLSPHNNHITRC